MGENSLRDDLRDVVNRHGVDSEYDIPDFVIAEYLERCLDAFGAAVRLRSGLCTEDKRRYTAFEVAGIDVREVCASGRTTRQMLNAPTNAVYVWCNESLRIAEEIAGRVGREDLRIVGPSRLERQFSLLGGHLSGVVLDHAAMLTEAQKRGYEVLIAHVRR